MKIGTEGKKERHQSENNKKEPSEKRLLRKKNSCKRMNIYTCPSPSTSPIVAVWGNVPDKLVSHSTSPS